MAMPKCTVATDVIGSMGTRPQDRPLTTQQFKDLFDQMPEGIKIYLNDILTVAIDTIRADKSELNALAAATAGRAYVDSLIESISSGSPEAFSNVAAINSAYPTGNNYVKLNLDDMYVYKWNGSAWVQGWLYQATGVSSGSVTYNALTPELTKGEDDMYKAINKPHTGTMAFVRFTFDCQGITNGGAINALFDMLSYDSNIPSCRGRVYQSASISDITGGISAWGDLMTTTPGKTASYNETAGTYDSTYRYVHILVGVTLNSVVLTKYYMKNVSLQIGELFLPVLAHALYLNTVDSVITQVDSPDESFVTDVTNIAFDQLAPEIYSDGTITRIYNKPQSNLVAYMKYTFDANSLTADNMNVIFDMLTFDANIVSCGAKIYLSSSADSITGGTNIQASTRMITRGDVVSYNKFAGPYDPTYRYVHVLVQANLTALQLSKYYLKNISLKIGDEDVPFVSSRAYSATEAYVLDVASIDEKLIPKVGSSKWYQKYIATFGDSLTWYDGEPFGAGHTESGTICKGYQSYMLEQLGCFIINEGLSGRNMVELWDELISTYDFSTGIDAVTIMSGASDAREDIQPGTVLAAGSTFTTTTFAGAIQASVERIINANPVVKIYLLTPVRGWFNEAGTEHVPGPYNNEMQISRDYVDVMLEIGRLYGIPVLNWYDNLGLNDINIHSYLGDNIVTAYYLHPTNWGYEQMAKLLIPFLENN